MNQRTIPCLLARNTSTGQWEPVGLLELPELYPDLVVVKKSNYKTTRFKLADAREHYCSPVKIIQAVNEGSAYNGGCWSVEGLEWINFPKFKGNLRQTIIATDLDTGQEYTLTSTICPLAKELKISGGAVSEYLRGKIKKYKHWHFRYA